MQLECSNGANATGSTTLVSFTTGGLGSNVPTVNITGPVTCMLTLVATDALGQTRHAAANITVRFRGAHAPGRPVKHSRAVFSAPQQATRCNL